METTKQQDHRFKKESKKMRDLAIQDFKGITPQEERIWLEEVDQRIESAQLLKTWIVGAIKEAKKGLET